MDNQQVRVGLENSTAIVCESCGNPTFKEASYLRKVSRLLTGSAEDMLVPVPTFICTKCGHVNEQFQIKEPKKPDPIIK
jgi:uncharacterized Zn finger protein